MRWNWGEFLFRTSAFLESFCPPWTLTSPSINFHELNAHCIFLKGTGKTCIWNAQGALSYLPPNSHAENLRQIFILRPVSSLIQSKWMQQQTNLSNPTSKQPLAPSLSKREGETWGQKHSRRQKWRREERKTKKVVKERDGGNAGQLWDDHTEHFTVDSHCQASQRRCVYAVPFSLTRKNIKKKKKKLRNKMVRQWYKTSELTPPQTPNRRNNRALRKLPCVKRWKWKHGSERLRHRWQYRDSVCSVQCLSRGWKCQFHAI